VSNQYEQVDSPDATTIFEYHDLTPPTLRDVYAARQVVRRYLPRTPLVRSEALSTEFDADVYLKREDTLPTGAFKVRGGVTLAASLDDEFRERGLIAASTGNHGASVAYAGRELDMPVVIGVPEDANPDKVATMEGLGARVEFQGSDFDEAREWVERHAAEEGYRYVHSANEPKLVAGVATAGLEIVEDLLEIDLLFSPVGGGSSASGYCLTVGALTDAEVIGVQSEAADAVYRAWDEEHLEPKERMETFAEGIATRVPFALTTEILRKHLDNMMLVSDDDLRNSIYNLLADDHILMEGASATAVAAMHRLREEITGKTIVFPVSGRNIALDRLRAIIDEYDDS
jgi:threonine dehydratase